METQGPARRRIGLMGGTFDPIHIAHLIVAEEVYAALDLAEMIFIPAGHPPHKAGRVSTPLHHRVAMVELAIASNPHFSMSLVEADRPGPSYLVDTLHLLHEQWGTNIELNFVIGWDSLEDFSTWYDPVGILARLTHLVAVRRPGYVEDVMYNRQLEVRVPGITERLSIVEVPQLDISSTEIRQRVAAHRSIKYHTPEAVERYIRHHQLYQTHTIQTESNNS